MFLIQTSPSYCYLPRVIVTRCNIFNFARGKSSTAKVLRARLRERPAVVWQGVVLLPPFLSIFFPRATVCKIRRKVSGAPLIRTFHAPAAVINTNERVSPTATARPAGISSKQTSELTARNIESRPMKSRD